MSGSYQCGVMFGKVRIGSVPRVVGVVSHFETLEAIGDSGEVSCDILEIRYDQMKCDLSAVLTYCERFETHGLPVIFTVRITSDGGSWAGDDESRQNIFEEALNVVSAIDIELSSTLFPTLCDSLTDPNKGVIVSHHDFSHTPDYPTLAGIVNKIAMHPRVVAKVSTMIESVDDIFILRRLYEENTVVPVCAIGMGAMGTDTRVSFAANGSCLTYGYIDKPSAPGQLHCVDLTARLRKLHSGYDEEKNRHSDALETQ